MEPLELLQNYLDHWGYWAVLVVVLLQNAGFPMPGETILLAAGWAAGRGLLQFHYVIVFGLAGAVIGDNIAYWIGAKGGRPLVLRLGKYFSITEAKFAKAEQMMLRHSNWAVFLGSFTSVLRVLAGPVAGVIHMPYRRYVFFDTAGVSMWVVLVSALGYLFGEYWDTLVRLMSQFSVLTSVILILAIIGWVLFRRFRKRSTSSCSD